MNAQDAQPKLSEREREILPLIVQGLNTDEIAAKLSLSPKTAKQHEANIRHKLGARNRTELVVTALQSGLTYLSGVAPPRRQKLDVFRFWAQHYCYCFSEYQRLEAVPATARDAAWRAEMKAICEEWINARTEMMAEYHKQHPGDAAP